MDHPLTDDDQIGLRRRVIQFFRSSYNAHRLSNIIFVCGGNDDKHMRMQFRSFCEENLRDYEIFFPEFAMGTIFGGDLEEPFDLADFEELIGKLSIAIVIFPEAAGSFAETGYFSAKIDLAKRSILALDTRHQSKDSFISMGPAKKISQATIFNPLVQLDYSSPDFQIILERIKRINTKQYKKALNLDKFSDLSTFELFSLVHEITNVLSVTTIGDLEFILRGIFKSRLSIPRVRQMISILVGANYFLEIGSFGHVTTNKKKPSLLETRDGRKSELSEIRLTLANIYQSSDQEFLSLIEESHDAH